MLVADQTFLGPTFVHMLQGLKNWLDKAAEKIGEHGEDVDAILTWQLAPDMYPLAGQIRFACYLAHEPYCRIQNMEPTEDLLEVRAAGWASPEEPDTFTEASDLLARTISSLSCQDCSVLVDAVNRPLTLELPDGHIFDLTGAEYIRDWALPQFYFHVNMAYAILRSHGIDLGKVDYVPHMFGYLRPPQSGSQPG
jgi:uncharacterized protein